MTSFVIVIGEDFEDMLYEYEQVMELPKAKDVNEAASGLIRIQTYYDIYCDDVKNFITLSQLLYNSASVFYYPFIFSDGKR